MVWWWISLSYIQMDNSVGNFEKMYGSYSKVLQGECEVKMYWCAFIVYLDSSLLFVLKCACAADLKWFCRTRSIFRCARSHTRRAYRSTASSTLEFFSGLRTLLSEVGAFRNTETLTWISFVALTWAHTCMHTHKKLHEQIAKYTNTATDTAIHTHTYTLKLSLQWFWCAY